MSQDDSRDAVLSLLAGISLGALVGAAVALLAAPQSGTETRRQIRETAGDAMGNLKESIDELRARLDEIRTSLRRGSAAGSAGELAAGEPTGGSDTG